MSKSQENTNTALHRMARRVRYFRQSQDGSLIVFGLFILVIMLMIGGMSVDLMRHEAARTQCQNTADRASLAAAAMRQTLEPEDVVTDYFEKAGASDCLVDTVVDEGLNYRNVRVDTRVDVPSMFMQMLGVDELVTPGVGAAEERITNVEISLVLDISGSMGSNSKIQNMRDAAEEFVREILEDDLENRISVSLVPYNGQVNIGPDLTDVFNITHQHGYPDVYCVDLPPSVHGSTFMSPTLPMPQTGYVDTFTNTSTTNGYVNTQAPNPANVWCPATSANFVQALSNDLEDIEDRIENLTAIGATSIDAGLRWGVALLDPLARPTVDALADLGHVPDHFRGRPLEWDDPEVLKVVVLMTDGEHFVEERLNDDYRVGPSPIFRRNSDGRYSIHHPGVSGSNKYWVPHRNEWRSAPWGGTSGSTRLDWADVWGQLRMKWVAWQLYARALGGGSSSWRSYYYNEMMSEFRSQTPTTTMDDRLQETCDAAKLNNVRIFGIAFEAPSNGRTQIQNCASPGLYYDVNGLQITTAFRQIRSQISQLRLTQ
jgi:Flp pilus assembly protein TadG